MKKLIGIVVLGLLLSGNAYAKQLKDIIFGKSAPERQLFCDSQKTRHTHDTIVKSFRFSLNNQC